MFPILGWAIAAAFGGGGSEASEPLDLKSVHALVVGVLQWQSPSFGSFSDADRQDRLFAQTLVARGVPGKQVTLLLDREATLEHIESELARVAGGAGAGSTLLFYYAGHGTRSGEGCCFANYDMHDASDGLSMERILRVVADGFAGTRFLAFADCCHSGSLRTVVDGLEKSGIDSGCVASVVPESTSTGNWTFTQTLVEAFAGDPSLDRDRDGFVELGELDAAVGDAMAWREGQRSGAHLGGLGSGLRLVPVVARPEAARERFESGAEPRFALGEHVTIRGEGPRDVGKIVGRDADGRWLVRRYAYATHEDVAFAAGEIASMTLTPVEVGASVGVRRGPDVVAGRVVAVDRTLCQVELPDWPDAPMEWIARAGLRAAPEKPEGFRACMVEWKGTWYPAFVLTEEPARRRIHYVGYAASWDEWVGEERVRFAPKR